MATIEVTGNIVDIPKRQIYPGKVVIEGGRIISVMPTPGKTYQRYILPGFIDAHVHIESSMLAPSEFARLAVIHGTVATVSDPHEIANVLGLAGIRFMIDNAKKVPFHLYFGAPSCVPATAFETAGAVISADDIRTLLTQDGLKYLSEMMNFPGVLHKQPDVMEKLAVAKALGRPIDGHAPGLHGEEACRYAEAGITTDHECFMLSEAIDKVHYGMMILIREGSAAKNFEELHPIIRSNPNKVMFCSDDKHPHELVQGHINLLVKRAVCDKGHDLFNVLRAACLTPIEHYHLEVGQLRQGDNADFIVLKDLHTFEVLQTYINGQLVADNGMSLIPHVDVDTLNHFHTSPKTPSDFAIAASGEMLRVIEVLDGQIVTSEAIVPAKVKEGLVVPDVPNDILKLAVVNRYSDAKPAVAFVKNVGLKKGALASSIAHDSHNIVAVGCSDEELCDAINAVIEAQGGIAAVGPDKTVMLSLPLAGLMSPGDGWQVAKDYEAVDTYAKRLGSSLQAPFMSLSFLALLVIPSLKLSDQGLFDVNSFTFTDLMIDKRRV